MPYSLLHAAAERHRWVATALTNPDDQAVINGFADEVDGLSRYEIAASDQAIYGHSVEKIGAIGAMLAKVFPLEPTRLFDNQIQALALPVTRGPCSYAQTATNRRGEPR